MPGRRTTKNLKSTKHHAARKTKPVKAKKTVITFGDSCGGTSSAQRFWVKKVISIRRVM